MFFRVQLVAGREFTAKAKYRVPEAAEFLKRVPKKGVQFATHGQKVADAVKARFVRSDIDLQT